MHHIGPDFRPVPPWMKKYILGTLSSLLMMKKYKSKNKKVNLIGEKLAQDFRVWEQHELLSIVQNQVERSPWIVPRSCMLPYNGISLSREISCERRTTPPPAEPYAVASTSTLSTPIITKQTEIFRHLLREVKKLTSHVEEESSDHDNDNDNFFMWYLWNISYNVLPDVKVDFENKLLIRAYKDAIKSHR